MSQNRPNKLGTSDLKTANPYAFFTISQFHFYLFFKHFYCISYIYGRFQCTHIAQFIKHSST